MGPARHRSRRGRAARAQPVRTEQPFPAEEASASPKLHPTTRQAIQATVACALAMVAGHALSSTRWYWAVIAAFVVFNRETTRGDILLRAWHRIFGTVVGVLAGLLVATVVHGHRDIELVLVFACVFLGFYLMQVSYAWMVFWFTTLLVVLYSLLGRYSPEMLSLRISETLVGAGIGAAVAMVLLPLRTGARVRQCSAEVLRGIASFLEAAATSSGRADGATVVENVRKIDTKLREVREAARPLTTFLSPGERDTRRLVHALASMALFRAAARARLLSAPSRSGPRPEGRGPAGEVRSGGGRVPRRTWEGRAPGA